MCQILYAILESKSRNERKEETATFRFTLTDCHCLFIFLTRSTFLYHMCIATINSKDNISFKTASKSLRVSESAVLLYRPFRLLMKSSNWNNITFSAPILLSPLVSDRGFNVNCNLVFINTQRLLDIVMST